MILKVKPIEVPQIINWGIGPRSLQWESGSCISGSSESSVIRTTDVRQLAEPVRTK